MVGQSLTGASGRRCKDDEKLVNAVLGIGKRGYIVDTRSMSIAKGAQKDGRSILVLDIEYYTPDLCQGLQLENIFA